MSFPPGFPPCPNVIDCPCDPNPYENLSAEGPDQPPGIPPLPPGRPPGPTPAPPGLVTYKNTQQKYTQMCACGPDFTFTVAAGVYSTTGPDAATDPEGAAAAQLAADEEALSAAQAAAASSQCCLTA